MNCAEFKELVGLYALGGLAPEQRRACEEHLSAPIAHEGCLEALAEVNAGVARLGEDLEPVMPTEAVWAAIQRRIAPSRPQTRRVSPVAYVGWGLAAAAALLLAWSLRNGGEKSDRILTLEAELAARPDPKLTAVNARALDDCRTRLKGFEADAALRAEAVALLELPGTQLFALTGDPKASANAILHTGVKRAYLVATGLVPVPAHEYEMWIVKDGRKIAAGTIHGDASGRALFRVDYSPLLVAGAPDQLLVTLEAEGGGNSPRGPAVLTGGPKT